MSREQSPQLESPFGYQLRELQNEVGISNLLEPSGPPLLSHNETNLLDQFFHDPNDLATDLFSKDFPGSADWPFAPRYGWDNSDLQVTTPQPNGGHLSGSGFDPEYTRANPAAAAPEQASLISASQEVYAAAASLVPNGNQSQPPAGLGTLGYTLEDRSQDINHYQANGYSNGQLQGSQYQMPGPSYSGLNHSYIPQESETWQGVGRQAPSIRFGSDDNFRSSSYAPETKPTRTVDDTFLAQLGLSDNPEFYQTTQPPPSNAPRSAARRDLENRKDNTIQSDGDGSADDEESFSQRKRRKRNSDDEQGDEYENSPSRKSKSGKGTNQRAASSKAQRGKNFVKHRNYSSAVVKPTRENLSEKQKRENHIMSEQKRRNLIKKGYDSLEKLVPELRQGGLSKSQILEETAAFMEKLRKDNDELKELLENG